MRLVKTALTIAGSDSGGGAGIEADLKTFTAFGVHGLVAITSVTAQNTQAVTAIHDIPPEVVSEQIKAVAEDIGVDAAKTGMLSNAEIIKAVAKTVKEYDFPLVVDPVMIAKSGAPLLREDAVEALIKHILPLATLVTPNRFEAEKLSGMKIKTVEDAKTAAKKIAEETGAHAVIVKGGHIEGNEAIDVLYHNGTFREYRAPRVEGCTHGTGCSFSAAITANLAKGFPLEDAIKIAKEFITLGIATGHKIGKGHCPVNQSAWIEIPAEKWRTYEELTKAVREFENLNPVKLIPEVGTNFVYSLPHPYARTKEDVAGVKGRIVKYGNSVKAVGPVEFGASDHLARAVLTYMKFYPEYRSAINIKYSEEIIDLAKEEGLIVSFYDRREEPLEVKEREGATIPWGIETAISRAKKRPDLIYHLGDVGKEPMILIFGKTPKEVLEKIRIIL
ncbi:bifunctional hydroxymethylpyrimidine kinase/phosphomethylpyrimidine kinase [Pyrococcus sp. ST04]|uniref:bifunctional hydroxymethylpyrimidine kinase/phosphomethylpyrimidine kinase n=1 Tax=Pyrococcus sp. ST04 TaxID=1183377 RepID=UPI0002605DEB|nr:bifunctional hydroxymethylpyrimidine kinase/phosphomethylpyrimidine kinase [Pyrococcus sp. ST04]AFK22517.1 phosphomethylpyrimidine kinase [Pyrococcus sp. ST04]